MKAAMKSKRDKNYLITSNFIVFHQDSGREKYFITFYLMNGLEMLL